MKSSNQRTAIVTGGSGGIGSQICQRLAKDGFNVVVHDGGNREAAESVAKEVSGAGGIAVTRSADVSDETEGREITINSVRPGATQPGMFAESTEERKEFFRNRSRFERLGRPDDIAAVVSFLASEDAACIAGQHLRVDGGASN
ncbi:SDR family oxidoreductase [Planctomycetes bacterium K23_9]|uniref:3-oxoacyl-[acyl-carrier-protein] reductase FabG n=1 Tax=Stieleria marina TaxID=1930275 RepID=A0A517NUL4_9BACT|nr:3-oxoacyl-[acyl-carrier-protein] reductase FabG [Planctomycetes bacterium K23_9]